MYNLNQDGEVSVISVNLKEGQFNFLAFKLVTLLEQILGS